LSTLSGWLPRRRAVPGRDGTPSKDYRPIVHGPLRRQPPVYSPLTWDATRRAALQGLGWRDDPRPRVERLVRALYRAQEAVLLGSGTQALELAIRVAVRVAGGQGAVALPAYSCYDVATAAVGADALIALYDVDPGTLGPDLDSLAAALAAGARVVVVAPLWGTPIDWGALERCTAPFGAVVIEDAAQGHGAEWHGLPVGSFGTLSVLSFGRGKGWTGARGGALLVRRFPWDTALATVGTPGLRSELGVACSAVAQCLLGRPAVYGLPAAIPWLGLGETRYRDPVAPRSMSRAAASLLERTLPLATREAAIRKQNAAALLAHIPPASRARPIAPPAGGRSGFLRLPLRLPRGLAGCSDPRAALRLGVAPGYPATLATLAPVRERLTGPDGSWPGAEDLVRELVTLPTHSLIGAVERQAMLRLLERYH